MTEITPRLPFSGNYPLNYTPSTSWDNVYLIMHFVDHGIGLLMLDINWTKRTNRSDLAIVLTIIGGMHLLKVHQAGNAATFIKGVMSPWKLKKHGRSIAIM